MTQLSVVLAALALIATACGMLSKTVVRDVPHRGFESLTLRDRTWAARESA